MKEYILYPAFAFASATINFIFGDFKTPILALLFFMLADLFMGIVKSYHGSSDKSNSGYLNSREFIRGIYRKIATLVLVGVANVCDVLLDACIIYNAVIFSFIAGELISILENYAAFGGHVPEIFTNVLEVCKEKGEIRDEEKD